MEGDSILTISESELDALASISDLPLSDLPEWAQLAIRSASEAIEYYANERKTKVEDCLSKYHAIEEGRPIEALSLEESIGAGLATVESAAPILLSSAALSAWRKYVRPGNESATEVFLDVLFAGVRIATTATITPSHIALLGAIALHGKPGGNWEKRNSIRDAWASGKYGSRDICAEQECAALGMSFSAARKALRGTPDPT